MQAKTPDEVSTQGSLVTWLIESYFYPFPSPLECRIFQRSYILRKGGWNGEDWPSIVMLRSNFDLSLLNHGVDGSFFGQHFTKYETETYYFL